MEKRYIDFAYPAHDAAPHHFFIQQDEKSFNLVECWGASSPGRIVRARIDADVFKRIRSRLKDAMNSRIKGVNATLKGGEKKMPAGNGWNRNDVTRIDRILGREICILFWALEGCPAGQEDAVIDFWQTYRPEEMWWIFIQADQDGRHYDTAPKGWRAALPIIFQKNVELS